MAKLPGLSDIQRAGYPLGIQASGRQKLPSESTKFPKFVPRQSLNMSHTAFGEFFPEIADKENKEYANWLQRHYRLVKGFIKDKNLH
jgi:hypothetical protein